jgi:flagellar biosynthesis protein FlhF
MKLRRFVGPSVAAALAQVKATLGPDALILETAPAPEGGGAVVVTAAVDHDPEAGGAGGTGDLGAEVRELSRLVRELLAQAWQPRPNGVHPALGALHRTLLAAGVEAAVAASLVEAAARGLAQGAGVEGALAAAVAGNMTFGQADGGRGPGAALAAPRVCVFFGPPGDGKTTTIAKLAARAATQDRRRVALLSADTYRVGGAGELGAYGRIFGVPHATVSTAAELRAAVTRFADADEILVDTAGVSSHETERGAELRALTAGLEGVRRVLVVSATTSAGVARRVCASMARLRPDSCIVTKVDEGVPAAALAACWRQRLPLAFFGTGRSVPRDLEPASAERMAAWLRAA